MLDYIKTYYLPIVIILLILIINLILYLNSIYFRQTKYNPFKVLFNAGLTGEYLSFRTLNKIKGYKRFIFNFKVPLENNKTTEIDIILIHESGIYVIESKNYRGLILGNKNSNNWTQCLYSGQHYKFYNPIKQNNTHINALKKHLGNKYNYYSYIVFSNECELKVDIDNVLNRRDLLDNINKVSNNKHLSITDIDNIGNLLKNE